MQSAANSGVPTGLENAPGQHDFFLALLSGGRASVSFCRRLHNEKARAIDESRKLIPGLFATGDCSGGFYYPCLMAGIAMGRTTAFAVKAVSAALGEEQDCIIL